MPGNKLALVTAVSRDPVAVHIVGRDQASVNPVGRDEDFSAGRVGVCDNGCE